MVWRKTILEISSSQNPVIELVNTFLYDINIVNYCIYIEHMGSAIFIK